MRKPGLEGLASPCPLPGTDTKQKGLAFLRGPGAPPEVSERPTPQAPNRCQTHGAGLKDHTLHLDCLQVRQSLSVGLYNTSLVF